MRLTAYTRLLLMFLTAFLTAIPICGQGSTTPAYFVFDYPPDPETFVFKLTDAQRIQEARDILASGARKMVAGTIIKQPVYYNISELVCCWLESILN